MSSMVARGRGGGGVMARRDCARNPWDAPDVMRLEFCLVVRYLGAIPV